MLRRGDRLSAPSGDPFSVASLRESMGGDVAGRDVDRGEDEEEAGAEDSNGGDEADASLSSSEDEDMEDDSRMVGLLPKNTSVGSKKLARGEMEADTENEGEGGSGWAYDPDADAEDKAWVEKRHMDGGEPSEGKSAICCPACFEPLSYRSERVRGRPREWIAKRVVNCVVQAGGNGVFCEACGYEAGSKSESGGVVTYTFLDPLPSTSAVDL